VDSEIDALFSELPAIHLDGPKAVGKTATALQRAKTVWRLDQPRQQAIGEADPDLLIVGARPVLIDEWQRVPEVWNSVKMSVDANHSGGQFLLTGSLPGKGTHSGAARITTIRMRPLTLPERGVCTPTVSLKALLSGGGDSVNGISSLGVEDYTDLILASGFPGFQHLEGEHLKASLDSYLTRIIDVDMEEAGHKVRRQATLMAWLRAYAAATSTATSWEKIRDATTSGARPSRSTTQPYIDILSRIRILDEIEAWIPTNNHLHELMQAPKHHLVDPALAARLVGVEKAELLRGEGPAAVPGDATFLGALFESLVALSLRVFAGTSGVTVQHLRTWQGKHEVDFIMKRADGKVLALEAKLSGAVNDAHVRHLTWLKKQIGDDLVDAVVVTTGGSAYRRRDGIAVVPLGLLGP
jgi:predicted AAA+ superfamily ATPase